MPMLFGDHMVLQQDSKIAVYGNADAGESVEVSFAGQNVKTAAGPDGKWIVYLKPIKPNSAGQPLTVTGRNKIVYDDVVVGDVWGIGDFPFVYVQLPNFEPVDAEPSVEGNKVIVSAPGITEPVAVRYGFSQSPVCNLYNEAGLPASPFRTDDWDN